MSTDPSHSTPSNSTPAPAPTINYLKLTLSLMAAVVFHNIIENWDAFKAGFNATALR